MMDYGEDEQQQSGGGDRNTFNIFKEIIAGL